MKFKPISLFPSSLKTSDYKLVTFCASPLPKNLSNFASLIFIMRKSGFYAERLKLG